MGNFANVATSISGRTYLRWYLTCAANGADQQTSKITSRNRTRHTITSLLPPRWPEDHAVAHQKIGQAAERDGQQVRQNVMQTEVADQQPHQQQVPADGHRACGQVEAQQPQRRLPQVDARAIRPGEALVPDEVVDYGSLHGQ